MQRCSKCNYYNDDGASFCSSCGTSLTSPVDQPQPIYQQPTPTAPPANKSKSLIIGAIAIVVMIIIAGIAIGMMTSGSSNEVSKVKVIVEYSGEWSGTYGDLGDMCSWDGDGSKSVTFTRPSSTYAVVANAYKPDGGSGTLTLKIVSMDGKVLKQSSTSAQYGFAQIPWSP